MHTLTLPTIGEVWPGQGGVFAGLMGKGTTEQPFRALIVPIALEAIFGKWAYSTQYERIPGADSHSDGAVNTRALIASGIAHPAAQACAGLVIEGHNDFYLPARHELALCEANVPELFEKYWYWSSTQYSAHGAWGQYFDFGNQHHYGKQYTGRARAVRTIQL